MEKILALLQGKKTYLVTGSSVLLLVAVNVFGINILGIQPSADWPIQVATLLGLTTIRAGVASK